MKQIESGMNDSNHSLSIPRGTRVHGSHLTYIALDIARSAVTVAGADAGKELAMKGVDLIPFVTGHKKGAPHEQLFWRGGNGKQWSVLAADGTKHLQDKPGKEPKLYYLPDDVSEAHDLLTSHPLRARELYAKWSEWNEGNVPCRLLGYIDYHKKRDQFFLEAIPKEATDAGYAPKVKANFK